MAVLFAAPVVILVLVLAVPVAYRHLWPIKLKRPRLFLAITLTMALVIAAVAIWWFFGPLMSVGISGTSMRGASSPSLESVLRNRLLVAAVCAAVVEYLLCRITQTVIDA